MDAAPDDAYAEAVGAEQVPRTGNIAAEWRNEPEREHVADGQRILPCEHGNKNGGGEHQQQHHQGARRDAIRTEDSPHADRVVRRGSSSGSATSAARFAKITAAA